MTGKLAEYVEKRVSAALADNRWQLQASAERIKKLEEEIAEMDREIQEEAEEKRKLQEEAEEIQKLKEKIAKTNREIQDMEEIFGDLDKLSPKKLLLIREYIKELNDYAE